MIVDINICDLNNDYFHFTNILNVSNILKDGLIPMIGPASKLVNDRPNVSISKGGKGIIGVISSFIYMFSTEIRKYEIPIEYRKYFSGMIDFNSNDIIDKNIVYEAIKRKLKDEVYFKIEITESQLEMAKVGGLTGYDINLPISIDKSKLKLVTDSNGNIMTAYDIALYIFEKVKNIPVFREVHEEFFNLFENNNYIEFEEQSVNLNNK